MRTVMTLTGIAVCALTIGASIVQASRQGRLPLVPVALYFAGGLLLSQAWHTYLVRRNNWPLKALPDFEIPSWYGYAYLPVLLALAIVLALWTLWTPQRSAYWAFLALIPVVFSQFIGRGLIRGGFDSIYWLILLLFFLIYKHYPQDNLLSFSSEHRAFIYQELWEVLKLSVTLGVFYLGTVGVAFAVQFLREEYFKGDPLAPWQMYRYGTLFVYSVVGIGFFVYRPLIVRISALRGAMLE